MSWMRATRASQSSSGPGPSRLQRLADLTLRGIGIVPLDLAFSGSGLLYVRAVPKSPPT